jgi:hypothetical protein
LRLERRLGAREDVLHNEEDGLDSRVTEDFDATGDQDQALAANGLDFEEFLALVSDEEGRVANVLPLVRPLHKEVAADRGDERRKALHDEPLDVRSLHEGAQQLEEVEGHAFNAVDFLLFETFIASLVLSFLLAVILLLLLICLENLIVRDDLCEDGQM